MADDTCLCPKCGRLHRDLGFCAPPGETAGAIETIAFAAIRYGDGVFQLPRPYRHHHVIAIMSHLGFNAGDVHNQGFVTSRGRYVDCVEAFQIATAAKQIISKHGRPNELYSEDVWEGPPAARADDGRTAAIADGGTAHSQQGTPQGKNADPSSAPSAPYGELRACPECRQVPELTTYEAVYSFVEERCSASLRCGCDIELRSRRQYKTRSDARHAIIAAWNRRPVPLGETAGARTDYAWVIESAWLNDGDAPKYFTGTEGSGDGLLIGWSDDHAQAIRFAREVDARKIARTVIGDHDVCAWKIVEHGWDTTASPAARPAQSVEHPPFASEQTEVDYRKKGWWLLCETCGEPVNAQFTNNGLMPCLHYVHCGFGHGPIATHDAFPTAQLTINQGLREAAYVNPGACKRDLVLWKDRAVTAEAALASRPAVQGGEDAIRLVLETLDEAQSSLESAHGVAMDAACKTADKDDIMGRIAGGSARVQEAIEALTRLHSPAPVEGGE